MGCIVKFVQLGLLIYVLSILLAIPVVRETLLVIVFISGLATLLRTMRN
jgi:hypothetical protein